MNEKDLLVYGFNYIRNSDDIESMILCLDGFKKMIIYKDNKFNLVINGCCSVELNIKNTNDLILALDLFSYGKPVC